MADTGYLSVLSYRMLLLFYCFMAAILVCWKMTATFHTCSNLIINLQ